MSAEPFCARCGFCHPDHGPASEEPPAPKPDASWPKRVECPTCEGDGEVSVNTLNELTVDDVLGALDTMMTRESLRLVGDGQVLSFGDDRAALFEAGGKHKFSGTLRAVLTEAKRRGLLG